MIDLIKLEIHASHACNLTCESCSHFSNHGHAGIPTLAEIEAQLRPWASRLQPQQVVICGGEPTMNKELAAIVRAVRAAFPSARIELPTNGFFLAKHPDLPAALGPWARLVLSDHNAGPRFDEAVALARAWKDGPEVVVRPSAGELWTRRYAGFGPTMAPLGAGDARGAWEACPARVCVQLHQGKLWKCPLVAYMGLQAARWPEAAARFPEMLAYRALEPSASDAEVRAFLAREDEPVCGHCPTPPQRFAHASPLVSAGRLLRAVGKLDLPGSHGASDGLA